MHVERVQIGYLDLSEEEIVRLDNGDTFLTLVRPVEGNVYTFGRHGDIFRVRGPNQEHTIYALRVISALMYNNKWLVTTNKMELPQPHNKFT